MPDDDFYLKVFSLLLLNPTSSTIRRYLYRLSISLRIFFFIYARLLSVLPSFVSPTISSATTTRIYWLCLNTRSQHLSCKFSGPAFHHVEYWPTTDHLTTIIYPSSPPHIHTSSNLVCSGTLYCRYQHKNPNLMFWLKTWYTQKKKHLETASLFVVGFFQQQEAYNRPSCWTGCLRLKKARSLRADIT